VANIHAGFISPELTVITIILSLHHINSIQDELGFLFLEIIVHLELSKGLNK
jgi:hypothetical protein